MSTLVYRHYDQAALDAQYEQRSLVPDVSPYFSQWREASDRVKVEYDLMGNLAYGSGERERIDLFPVDGTDSALALFFHGGAWRRLSKDEFLYPAPVFLDHGIAFAVVGFDLVPAVSLAHQVAQARQALAWIRSNAGRFGIDAERIFLIGNSSGGHLAGLLMGVDDNGLSTAAQGALLVSGIYDLEPVRLSARNDYLNLDPATATQLSPRERIPSDCRPLVVGWGGGELAEFQRQSTDFADSWEERGGQVERIFLPGHNHFDMTTELGRAESPLLEAFIRLVERV